VAIVLALPRLFDAVVARFALEAPTGVLPVPNYFGWREPARQRDQITNRILWVPGDVRGQMGRTLPARNPGRAPARPIATLDELFTCEIVAHDSAAHEVERSQYQAARELYDAWWRAVYLEAHGTVAVISTEWITLAKERRHGAAIRAICSVQSAIFDTPYDLAPADTGAAIVVQELDVTEIQTIEANS
jgi:hypothetical protein